MRRRALSASRAPDRLSGSPVPTLVGVTEWERASGDVIAGEAMPTPAGSGAVAWDIAERVAGWVGNRSHLPAPYRPDLLQT